MTARRATPTLSVGPKRWTIHRHDIAPLTLAIAAGITAVAGLAILTALGA